MQTFEEQEKLIYINQLLNKILENSPESLQRVESLGSQLSFAAGLIYFERILDMMSELKQSNLSILPLPQLDNLEQIIQQFQNYFDQITSFSASNGNPISTRDNILNQLISLYNSYYINLMQYISITSLSKDSLKVKEIEFETLLKNLNDLITDRLKDIDTKYENIIGIEEKTMSILESAKLSSAKIGIAQHANYFETESKEHTKTAKLWLGATVFIGLITIGWGYFGFSSTNSAISVGDAISILGSKVIVLSVLYYILVWCAKNYNASRHNYIINKHRKNALHTFESFVKSADDIETKNAVLIQATQSIFSNQPSGYVNKESDQDSTSKVIEIMRNITPLSKIN